MRDVEGGLGAKVSMTLPYDPFLYLKAVNEGIPVVIGAGRTPVSAALVSLAGLAFGERTRRPRGRAPARNRSRAASAGC